ncbi:MAG: SLBB domain-containing protein, partial [Caulobacteraceae bacterium]
EVSVLGRTDFTTRARVGEDGTIQVPYLGTVHPGGKTPAEFADDLAAALEKGGFYSHPIMSVEIVSYASRYVTVLGEVGTPGLIPVDRAYHLSEILARVGGIKEQEADTVILTHGTSPPERLSVRALATGNPADDPFVQPGDRIFVPEPPTFYVSGEVKAPGAFPILSGMTVRMAIARAGGVSEDGSLGKVKVSRDGREIHVSLDSDVKPGDVITVGERLF